jgi:hypothetical protein
MDITNEDVQQMALRIGMLELEKTILERHLRELTQEIATQENESPNGLVIEMANTGDS